MANEATRIERDTKIIRIECENKGNQTQDKGTNATKNRLETKSGTTTKSQSVE